MAEKSRSLNYFLLICALIGAALFYGCSGGVSSDPIPASTTQITGTISESDIPRNMAYDASLKPELRARGLGNVRVWLESNYEKYAETRDDGSFAIPNVPPGKHRVVAKFTNSANDIYKTITPEISVAAGETKSTSIELRSEPHKVTVAINGELKKADGSALSNARIYVWGEPFFADAQGRFTLPMPAGATATVVIDTPGYQKVELKDTKFEQNAPSIVQTVVDNSATNRAPSAGLSATAYSIEKGYEVGLTGAATDPDNNIATYSWSATSGHFASHGSVGDTQRSWIAPNTDTVATITFSITDAGGLSAAASIQVKVGRGFVTPNSPPSVGEISITPDDFSGNRNYTLAVIATDSNGDVLTYNWVATSTSNKIGTFVQRNSATVVWVSPDVSENTDVTLTVNVDDLGENGKVAKSRTITIESTRVNQPPTDLAINLTDLNGVATTTFYAYKEYLLNGSATDPEGEAIRWEWSGSGRINSPTASTTRWLTPSTPQTVTMTLTVTDAKNASTALTRTINILDSGLPRPTVVITASPSTGLIKIGQKIDLEGSATDANNAIISQDTFSWYEYTGTADPKSIGSRVKLVSRQYTTPATYTVMLEAIDNLGVPGSIEYSFRVNASPTVTISAPTAGSSFNRYASVTFTANATDVEDGNINVNEQYTWTFPDPVGIKTGKSLSTDELPPGDHTITVCAADSLGIFAATASVQIQIIDNAPPVATITAPINLATYQIGSSITFTATASDREDTTIPEDNFIWTFPAPINAATGTSVTVSSLPAGNNTVTLYVVDSRGLHSQTKTVEVYINQPPQINSIAPASGTAILLGDPVNFVADISAGSTVAWYRNSTLLGNGASIQVSDLPAGAHVIDVVASDSRGGTTASQTGIFINERPVMTINLPIVGQSFGLNQQINFSGAGNDTSGLVGIDSFKWSDYSYRRNATSTMRTGEDIFTFEGYTSTSDFGSHTITLEGTDQHGATGFATREIFINSTPAITMTSPASGTRHDTDTLVTFTANVIEEDSTDNLTIRWYNGSEPSTTLFTEGINSSKDGTTVTYATDALPAGYHEIFCEVTDMYGSQAVASTGVLINRLPYAQSGKIKITTAQYATAPAGIPVFLSSLPTMSIGFTIDDYDYEIAGTINDYNQNNIRWESNFGAFIDSKGSAATQSFPIGYNEVTVRLYDSFYPQFEHQASSSYKIAFYVWQSTYLTIPAKTVNMFGDTTQLLFASNAIPAIHEYAYKGGAEPVPYTLEDEEKRGTLDALATFPFDLLYSVGKTKGGIAAGLGISSDDGKEGIVTFDTLATPTFRDEAELPEITGAQSLAFNPNYETFAYMISGATLVAINPSTWSAVGAPLTNADGKNFGTLGQVRFFDTSNFVRQVMVADPTNNRVVRYLNDTLAEPRSINATSPIDMAATPNRLLVLNNADSQISLHAVDNASSSALITFGGATVAAAPGKFNNPVAVYFYDKDLLILELGDPLTGANNRLQLIRSGEENWLK